MVGGLDGRYGIEADALVGAVQALVADAESGGGGDAQPGQLVADVGRSYDLGYRGEPGQGGSLSAVRRAAVSRLAGHRAATGWWF